MAMSDVKWDRNKRRLAWIHLGIQIAVVLGVVVMANLLAQKFPKRWDLTASRRYAVSAMAEDLLATLKYDVEIWVSSELYATADDKSLPNAIGITKDVLEEFRRRSDHIKVYDIVGQNTTRADVWRQHWNVATPASLYLLAHLDGKRTTQKQIDIQELYQGNSTTGEISVFKGEPVLVQAIRELGGSVKRFIYESEGHREAITADVRKMSTLTNFLKLNDGVEFRRLPLADYKTVPIDCDLLMIMAPEQPFTESELEVVKEYLERGGSLLVSILPKKRTGLEKLLEEYHVKVGDNLVLDPQQFKPPSRASLWVVDFNLHPVNRNMTNVQFNMPQSCTIDPIPKKDKDWLITPLAMAGANSWEEKGDLGPGSNPKPDADERVGNMKLIVAVEKKAKYPMEPKETHQMARIVVWGSSLPFTNEVLRSPYEFQSVQGQYVINHFRWLMDRQLLTVGVKEMGVKPVKMSGEALNNLRWVIMAGFPAFGVLLGVLAWFMRRK
jgi:hypothetical protein